jgi:hypothetical protein
MTTELGAYLDPLADKALIVSIYITLGIYGLIPGWLVILVVSRDIMIVGAVMLSWLVGTPVKVKPLLVSKLNTACSDRLRLRRTRHTRLCISSTEGLAGAYGIGRSFDVAVCRGLRGRMGAPHEFHGGEKVSAAPTPFL